MPKVVHHGDSVGFGSNFQSSADTFEMRENRGELIEGDAERVGGAKRHGGVVNIVAARELEMKFLAVEREAAASGVLMEDLISGGGLWT